MAQMIHLDVRKTHGYVGTCKHLDQHEYLGMAKMLGGRKVMPPDDADISVGPSWMNAVIVPRGVDRKLWAQAIHDTFASHGCHHDYDCCGCASVTVDVRFITKRRAFVHRTTTYNY